MTHEQHIALLQKIADDLGQRIGLGFDGLPGEIEGALAELRKEADAGVRDCMDVRPNLDGEFLLVYRSLPGAVIRWEDGGIGGRAGSIFGLDKLEREGAR